MRYWIKVSEPSLMAYQLTPLIIKKCVNYQRTSQNFTLCPSKLWLYSSKVQKASDNVGNTLHIKNSDGKMTSIRTKTIKQSRYRNMKSSKFDSHTREFIICCRNRFSILIEISILHYRIVYQMGKQVDIVQISESWYWLIQSFASHFLQHISLYLHQ